MLYVYPFLLGTCMHSLSNMWLPGATSNLASDSWILDTTDTVDGSEIQQSQVEVGV